jgi:flagellar basal-body rod protein FlgF
MDTTAYIALSQSIALDRQMTVIANNLANTGTSGYRAEHTEFETVLERSGEPRTLAFVQDRGMIRDLAPGPLEQTGDTFDLAISGDAYFTLRTPEGERYTRAGHFGVDAENRIVTSDGAFLLGEDGQPVVLPERPGKVAIAADGTITTDEDISGRVVLVRFAQPLAMRREMGSRYAADEVPQPAPDAAIMQGWIEQSNVQPIREITLMIDTQRAFESSIRLIEVHHDLERKAVDKIADIQA